LVGLANLDEIKAVGSFLEAIGLITKVLCSLLLRPCLKDTGAARIGWTTFGGETGPTPASQGHGDTIKQNFVIVTLQYRNQNNQGVLLVGPLVLPRSFLTPFVMLGILMK
jgi:hypothetical protein